MFYNIMKSENAMKKQARKWAEIAEDLGFENPATQDISMMGCNGLKVCTKYMKLLPDDIKEYVAGVMLDAAIEHDAYMDIWSENGSSAHLNLKHLSILLDPFSRKLTRSDIEFAYNALEIGDSEPMIKYPMHIESSMEGARNQMRMFYRNYENDIKAGIGLSIIPGSFSLYSATEMATQGNSFFDSSLAGIGTGMAVFGAEAGIIFMAAAALAAKSHISNWREEKKNERKLAEEALREQAAKEAHYDTSGACVCIVPEKCAVNAIRANKKK